MRVATEQTPDLILSQEPIFRKQAGNVDIAFYGKIYNQSILEETDFSQGDVAFLKDLLNRLAGYFLVVCKNRQTRTCYIGNDIFGNFRLYYRRMGERLRFSDDWQVLADEMRDEDGCLRLNEHERHYQDRHSYTTGGHTLVEGLEKQMPGSLMTISDKGWAEEIYFRTALDRTRDDEHYRKKTLQLLTENVRRGIITERNNIVLFSGGVDSTLLCLIMRREQLPFTPVLIQYDPPDRDNVIDQRKAQAVAESLGLELRVIGGPIRDNIGVLKSAFRRHPFDQAFAVPYYQALDILRDEYGPCNLINGQSADSIYCQGPSSKTIGGLIQRYILSGFYARFKPVLNQPVARVTEWLYSRRWQMDSELRVPTGISDYGQGLLDPQVYLPIVHTGTRWRDYRQYLGRIVGRIAGQLDYDVDAIRMYMKMMYLQGTSNVFPIESAKEYGHNLVMPFTDARLVYLKMQYQKEWKNLFRPKYVLEETLSREFSFDPDTIDRCRRGRVENREFTQFREVEKEVRREWDRLSEGLW